MIVLDIETDGVDIKTSKLKFLGCLDVETKQTFIFDHTQLNEMKAYLDKKKVIIGFNIKGFDIPILERYGISFKYKSVLDLYTSLSPQGNNYKSYQIHHKDRLRDINPTLNLPDYKLNTILKALNLEEKEELDYNILKKNEWTEEELEDIKKYLIKDLEVEFKLFEWYRNIFKPLESYLDLEEVRKLKHLSCTSGSLAYKIISYLSGDKVVWRGEEEAKHLKKITPIRIEGGYHLNNGFSKIRGNIICRDFVSQYPHILIMYNLLPKKQEKAVEKILLERLNAKSKGDKIKALALKVPLNSIYGILGNPLFKNIYNPKVGAECTRIGREQIRKYAKTLHIAGFVPIYGFTDSCYIGIPKNLNETDLDNVTNYFIEQMKKESPNPLDSFGLGVDGKFKFMWFLALNNYLYVKQNDEVGYKGGALFNKNTPLAVLKLFETYIKPKIIRELDVNFKEEELLDKLLEIIKEDVSLAGEEYSVKDLENYNSITSPQYQISQRYGEGKHLLIPNTSGVGVGKKIQLCSLEEFKENNLTIESIPLDKMKIYLRPFYQDYGDVVDLNDDNFNWRCREK